MPSKYCHTEWVFPRKVTSHRLIDQHRARESLVAFNRTSLLGGQREKKIVFAENTDREEEQRAADLPDRMESDDLEIRQVDFGVGNKKKYFKKSYKYIRWQLLRSNKKNCEEFVEKRSESIELQIDHRHRDDERNSTHHTPEYTTVANQHRKRANNYY